MKKHLIFCLLVMLPTVSSIFALDEEDHKTINQMIGHFSNAWNYRGGEGSADYYAQDADFVNIF